MAFLLIPCTPSVKINIDFKIYFIIWYIFLQLFRNYFFCLAIVKIILALFKTYNSHVIYKTVAVGPNFLLVAAEGSNVDFLI